MKKLTIFCSALAVAAAMSSCEDFLDTLPDSRAEVNSEAKVTSLLVSAYPQYYPATLWEMSSDNVMDNGSMYGMESKVTEDAYLWKDIVATDSDSPYLVWTGGYAAIANANHALRAIEEMGGGEGLNAQKGEALVCRAFAHFMLANTFCEAYDPLTADSKLGIPYATEPEEVVSPTYTRGTLAETYKKIEEDLLAGLPLIDDNLYTVPKYHFNKKAAYAFAARFYLFYVQEDRSNYDKVIHYADLVLGTNPQKMLRDWDAELGIYNEPSNFADGYISDKASANLLLLSVYSVWPSVYGPTTVNQRYGLSRSLCTGEVFWAAGVWSKNMGNASGTGLFYDSAYGLPTKMCMPKYGSYMEYTDKQNGSGYLHTVFDAFTTDETLECRAEAYIMKAQPDYAAATNDINLWIQAHASGMFNLPTVTATNITTYYGPSMAYSTESARTVKKKLSHPLFTLDQYQEAFMHCILHMRRIEGVHSGSRWLDVKRWGIEISHNIEGRASELLRKDDPRRAIQLPQDVISMGLEANPR